MKLSTKYAKICEAYKDALNEMWDTDGYWIGMGQYDVLDVSDCFVDLSTVRICVDNKVPFDVFHDWYEYNRQIQYGKESGDKDAVTINLDHWLMGFPEDKKVPEEKRRGWEKRYLDSVINQESNLI